jgi:hypothetical protein
MDLNRLHTISGLLIILFFAGKVIIHYYLDYKHSRNTSLSLPFMAPFPYFLPYKATVVKELLSLKQICNMLLLLTSLALILNFIIGIAIYVR